MKLCLQPRSLVATSRNPALQPTVTGGASLAVVRRVIAIVGPRRGTGAWPVPKQRVVRIRMERRRLVWRQFGCTLWLLFLGFVFFRRDALGWWACIASFLVLNAWGFYLWRSQQRLRAYAGFQRFFLAASVVIAFVVWLVNTCGLSEPPTPGPLVATYLPYWLIAVPPARASGQAVTEMTWPNPAFERTSASVLRLLAVPSSPGVSADAQRERLVIPRIMIANHHHPNLLLLIVGRYRPRSGDGRGDQGGRPWTGEPLQSAEPRSEAALRYGDKSSACLGRTAFRTSNLALLRPSRAMVRTVASAASLAGSVRSARALGVQGHADGGA